MTHQMTVTTVLKPTNCMACKKMLLGVVRQGLGCTNCKMICHKRCEDKLPTACKYKDGDVDGIIQTFRNSVEMMGNEIDVDQNNNCVANKEKIFQTIEQSKGLSGENPAITFDKLLATGILKKGELDDYYMYVSGNGHDLEEILFKKPTYCKECTGLMVDKQGLKCKTCGYSCHSECYFSCSSLLASPCHNDIISAKLDVSHDFHVTSFNKPAYCNGCQSMLYGLSSQGIKCSICSSVYHNTCAPTKSCQRRYVETEKEFKGPPECNWIEGNVNGKQVCCACRKSISSQKTTMTGLQCSMCRDQIHMSCFQNHDKTACSLGPVGDLVVPYSNIRTEQVDGKVSLKYWSPHEKCPLLVFINKRSGGQVGEKIIKEMHKFLNPLQVFDLSEGGPSVGLQAFKDLTSYRILACGGDGTAGWVLQAMDKFDYGEHGRVTKNKQIKLRPPVSVLPLGTGNDLARVLGYGGGYAGESMKTVLTRVLESSLCKLDRWELNISQAENTQLNSFIGDNAVFNNYFSVGIDAKIALGFHEAREKNPNRFKSRAVNKMYYAQLGVSEVFQGCKQLKDKLTLTCDGKVIDIPNVEGIVVLNLPSYAGGTDLWTTKEDTSGFAPQSISDGLLEVVGIKSSFHMGVIKISMSSATRIAQCQRLSIKVLDQEIPVQIDGEPWMQGPCTMDITHLNTVPMLYKKPREARTHSK